MKLELKYYNNIFRIKKDWEKIYSSNENLSVFQDFEYNKNIFIKNLYRKKRIAKFIKIIDIDTNEVIMIAPLTKRLGKEKPNRFIWGLFGDIQGCDICDFIYYKDMSLSLMIECFKLIRKNCVGSIVFRRINENSLLLKALKEIYPSHEFIPYPYVKINTDGNYDNYIKSLSKSVRQNIRTAYNRLEKDKLTLSLDCAIPTKNNIKLWNESLKVYVDRQIYQFDNTRMGSHILTRLYYKFSKHDSISLRDMKNSCLFCLRINDKIAGMFTGFRYEKDKSIVIPRLAIDPKYKIYSPGYLLIAETIKYLLSNTDINSLDLSRGDEEYKFKMGGVEYHTYFIRIEREE